MGGEFLPYAGSDRGLAQALEHDLHAALLDPGRQQVAQGITAGSVGVLIDIDLHAALAGGVDLRQQPGGTTPIVGARELEMGDLHVDAAGLADGDGLPHRLEDVIGLIPDVRGIAGAVPLQHATQGDHFLGLGKDPRCREQAGGQPQRASLQGLLQQMLHQGQLVGPGRSILHPHGQESQRIMAHLHDGIHRGGREGVEIVSEGGFTKLQPGGAGGQVIAQHLDPSWQRRRGGEAAVAQHFGGDALADLALRPWIQRQGEVGVRVNVDKAGRDHLSGGIDDASALPGLAAVNRHNTSVGDRHIGDTARCAAAIDHFSPTNHQIVHAQLLQLAAALHLSPTEAYERCLANPMMLSLSSSVSRRDVVSG